jgi:hypothetical protein
MARSPRIVVPSFEPPAENSEPNQPESYPPADVPEPAAPEVGDVGELADNRYTEYSWSIYRLRSVEEINRSPQAGPRSLVTKRVGPIDILELQREFGGGIYEFWAYFDQNDGAGKRLRFRRVYAVDGPRKDVTSPVTAPAAAPAGTDPQLAAILGQINRTLERLENRAATPATPAPATQPFPFKELVELSKLISDRATPALAGASVTEMMGLVQQGIELGKSTQPGSEPSTVAVVLEKLAPSLERLAATLLTRRAPPPPRRPTGGPVPSSAQVVSEPEAPEPPSDDETRMSAAIDALARAVIEQTPAEDFAFVLEHSLSREQVAMLRLGSTEQIMGQLSESGALAKYPILATEAAAPYLDTVLTELRNPSGEE